jgi:amidase
MSDTALNVEELTIDDIHSAFRDGVTAADLVRAYLKRIDVLDAGGPSLNAVITTSDAALERAGELDELFARSGRLSGPLHGVPILVKDNINTADLPTTYGSIAMDGFRPSADAPVVQRLREAGAVILGKTTLPDWATSWFSYSSKSELTRNPFDTDRDPGGSSSGSASAVSANLAAAALGTDCGGSVRLPASFCGLVGVRSTPGAVPRTGSSYLVMFQDTIGPMTRTVRDAAKLMDVLVGYDEDDPYSVAALLSRPSDGFEAGLDNASLNGARLGLLKEALGSDDEPDPGAVNAVTRAAVGALEEAGATVVEISIPGLWDYIEQTSMYVDHSKHDIDLFLGLLEDPPVRTLTEVYEKGLYHKSLDLMDAFIGGPDEPSTSLEYLQRYERRQEFTLAVLDAMARNDVSALIFPTAQVPAPTLAGREDWTTLTFPTNTLIASQTWLPAVTVPGGFTETGLPVGLELVGQPYDEAGVLRLAHAFEAITHHRRAPELPDAQS